MNVEFVEESPNLVLARYHSPALGRFLSVDPGFDVQEEDPQRWNLYSYSRNSPMCLVDPTGEGIRDSIAKLSDQYRAAASAVIEFGAKVQEFGDSLNGGGVGGIAADATLGTVGSMIQGAGDMLNLGTSVGEVAGAGGSGEDYLRAGAEEAGRAGGIVLTVVSLGGGARVSSTTLTEVRVPTVDGPVTVPRGSVRSMATNGEGVVYRPAGSTGNANAVRAAGPNARNPNGYARVYNANGQPVSVVTGKPAPRAQTHPALNGRTTTRPPRTTPAVRPPQEQP